MKRYLVIGNPISHSLSPKLHNYWLKKNNINGIYKKKKLDENNLKEIFSKIRKKEIMGINVTVPFKKIVIPYLDKLTTEAEYTQSVNTIYLQNNKIIGHNTDIKGFELAIKDSGYDIAEKKILILGAGGVVPSIIFALYNMKVFGVTLCNRTKTKAENLKNLFKNLNVIDWGEKSDFDVVINATSVGLKKGDELVLDFSYFKNCDFFYDVIYNPKKTNFLKTASKLGKKIENGKKMFIYQAAQAFKIWHGVEPEINDEVKEILDK
ncbi:shikimate dehydrogenase [Pelagibacterales bacterium SAG-MED13]|mgnify:CR=1 FL=1|nr:shikimate dehydrogenase [Pelagibacterales bacterium SAG-MED13]